VKSECYDLVGRYMNLIWEEMKHEKSFLFDVGRCVMCLATLVWQSAGSPAGRYSGGVVG
jgi:hypothetical protein